MRKTGLVLAALLLAGVASPSFAGGDPFEEARVAIMAGKVEAAMMNVTTGAISANTHNEEGYTLLHYAAQAGSLDAVQQLLDRGADPLAKTKDGKTQPSIYKLDGDTLTICMGDSDVANERPTEFATVELKPGLNWPVTAERSIAFENGL